MSHPASSEHAAHPAAAARGSAALWFAVFGPPAAWMLSLAVGYFAVHEACRVHSPLGPRIVSIVALVVSIAAGLTGRSIWRANERHERTRFMAQVGVLASGVFSLIMLLQIFATVLLGSCHERPRTSESPDVFVPRITTQRSLT